MENPPLLPCTDPGEREIRYLNEIIPENPNAAYDMKEVILQTVDNGDFFEIKRILPRTCS
jgi:methylmalonyl-CoA decarboxylase subunit alpha